MAIRRVDICTSQPGSQKFIQRHSLTGLIHIYHPTGFNNTLRSQGFILTMVPTMGTVSRTYVPRTGEGLRSPDFSGPALRSPSSPNLWMTFSNSLIENHLFNNCVLNFSYVLRTCISHIYFSLQNIEFFSFPSHCFTFLSCIPSHGVFTIFQILSERYLRLNLNLISSTLISCYLRWSLCFLNMFDFIYYKVFKHLN